MMNHPAGFATVTRPGGEFVAWIPNGVRGAIYLLTPDEQHAVVNFEGKLVATVPLDELSPVLEAFAVPA
jgi:hypothetical protein